MSFLPSDPTTLCVNAERLVLQTGNNTYSVLQDLRFPHIRPELKEPVTGLGTGNIITAVYFYGPGDNYIECTLLMSDAEYQSFSNNFIRDANGKLPVGLYQIVATNLSGGTATITNNSNTGFKCVIPNHTVDKPIIGGVKLRLRLRLIEDHVTVNITSPS
jgi:hypothetical protein